MMDSAFTKITNMRNTEKKNIWGEKDSYVLAC